MPSRLDPVGGLPVREVTVPIRPLSRLEPIIGAARYGDLQDAAASTNQTLQGRTIWNISSTAAGGGVAEMLQVLVGYTLDAGVDIRWLVITGDADFFAITKRIHNRLHGAVGDGGQLGTAETAHYTDITAANALTAARRVRPGDVVLLHDPQTVGMAAPLAAAGARVVWRCHVGRETTNEWTEQAWGFLRPHLAPCEAFIFSVLEYIPAWVEESRAWVIPPSIDPFSPKNQKMSEHDVSLILRRIGLVAGGGDDPPAAFTRPDGTRGWVERRASIVSDNSRPAPDTQMVVQVSRWDRLKDMAGVMNGFVSDVAARRDTHLALVGPAAGEVTDDPEGAEVFAECLAIWESLPAPLRRRVSLVTLPMDDIEENAAMVNAIQRHAAVIVQKSLAEGFGLTVAEGMWKGRAVVASRVGGIPSQIAPGTGLLLDDATDLSAFGRTLAGLLADRDQIAELGARAHQHVRDCFVGDEHLLRYARLIGRLVS